MLTRDQLIQIQAQLEAAYVVARYDECDLDKAEELTDSLSAVIRARQSL